MHAFLASRSWSTHESAPLEQIVGQLDKLVNVVAITDLAPKDALERELLLATLSVDDVNRATVLDVTANTGAAIVDVNGSSVTVMLAGTPSACDLLERELERFGDVAIQRTGRVALPRLDQTARATIEEKV